MSKLTRIEIAKLMERYIGSSGGYLGTFDTSSELTRFYVDCGVDVIVKDYAGTNKDRFRQILENATADEQSKIIFGILNKYPVGSAETRTQLLFDEQNRLAQRLAAGEGVTNPAPTYTSDFVKRTLHEVEESIKSKRETSGVDRVHSALHGYLRNVCNEKSIAYSQDERIVELFKKLLSSHPAMTNLGPRPQDTCTILKSFCAIMTVADPLRNKTSYAHPTSSLLEMHEAMLIINSVRTIIHYLDAKLAPIT